MPVAGYSKQYFLASSFAWDQFPPTKLLDLEGFEPEVPISAPAPTCRLSYSPCGECYAPPEGVIASIVESFKDPKVMKLQTGSSEIGDTVLSMRLGPDVLALRASEQCSCRLDDDLPSPASIRELETHLEFALCPSVVKRLTGSQYRCHVDTIEAFLGGATPCSDIGSDGSNHGWPARMRWEGLICRGSVGETALLWRSTRVKHRCDGNCKSKYVVATNDDESRATTVIPTHWGVRAVRSLDKTPSNQEWPISQGTWLTYENEDIGCLLDYGPRTRADIDEIVMARLEKGGIPLADGWGTSDSQRPGPLLGQVQLCLGSGHVILRAADNSVKKTEALMGKFVRFSLAEKSDVAKAGCKYLSSSIGDQVLERFAPGKTWAQIVDSLDEELPSRNRCLTIHAWNDRRKILDIRDPNPRGLFGEPPPIEDESTQLEVCYQTYENSVPKTTYWSRIQGHKDAHPGIYAPATVSWTDDSGDGQKRFLLLELNLQDIATIHDFTHWTPLSGPGTSDTSPDTRE